MYGLVIGINVSYSQNKTDYQYTYTPYIPKLPDNYTTTTTNTSYIPLLGILTGVRFKVNESFYVYAEISPNINYNYTQSISTNTQVRNSTGQAYRNEYLWIERTK